MRCSSQPATSHCETATIVRLCDWGQRAELLHLARTRQVVASPIKKDAPTERVYATSRSSAELLSLLLGAGGGWLLDCWVGRDAPRWLSTCSRPTASCTYYRSYRHARFPSVELLFCFACRCQRVAVAGLPVVPHHHHRAPSAWPSNSLEEGSLGGVQRWTSPTQATLLSARAHRCAVEGRARSPAARAARTMYWTRDGDAGGGRGGGVECSSLAVTGTARFGLIRGVKAEPCALDFKDVQGVYQVLVGDRQTRSASSGRVVGDLAVRAVREVGLIHNHIVTEVPVEARQRRCSR